MWEIASDSVGIGLRSEHIDDLCQKPKRQDVDFFEVVPDNWMEIGGAKKESLSDIARQYPLIAHSLSLSIGDTLPLNEGYINSVRRFLDEYRIKIYSDHLCFSRDQQGYLYDLLPVPGFADALPWLTERIHRVQDLLGRQLVLENVSAYHRYAGEMPEAEFWAELLHQSGCGMLLDINNVFVNAFNHHFDALDYIRTIPGSAIVYYHIAGHLDQDQFKLDTHGMPVSAEVLELARQTFALHGARPLLLERDNHVPPLEILCRELTEIQTFVKS